MTLRNTRNQRGAGAIGCILLLAFVGAGLYAAYELGMPRLRHSSFEDRINETIYHFQRQPAELVAKQIIEIASEFDIALTPDQVKVESSPSGTLRIDVVYEKAVDLKVWQTKLRFTLRRASK